MRLHFGLYFKINGSYLGGLEYTVGGVPNGAGTTAGAGRWLASLVPIVLVLVLADWTVPGVVGAGPGFTVHSASAEAATLETPSCGDRPTLVADGTTWRCTFDSEFNGTSLDTNEWTPVETATSGYTSGEMACFVNSPKNISVRNGYLSLTARKLAAPFTCDDPLGNFRTLYTSGYVTTSRLYTQTLGRVEVLAKVPASEIAGLQSSFWLYPQSGTAGEMDIAETYSNEPGLAIPYFHYLPNLMDMSAATDTNMVTSDSCTIRPNRFNDFVLEWSSTTISVIYNGATCMIDHFDEFLGAPGAPFNQPMFINLTQALGIGSNNFDPATTPLPATTEIKYVRAWQAEP